MTPKGQPMRFYQDVVLPYQSDDCLTWPYSKSGEGYALVESNGRTNHVHRLACGKVNGPPPTPKHQAAHSCGKGSLGCVNPRHLSWKTQSENERDKLRHGTHNRGERHGMAKLNADTVREIRALEGNLSKRKMAAKFGVSHRTIGNILAGRSWGRSDAEAIEDFKRICGERAEAEHQEAAQ